MKITLTDSQKQILRDMALLEAEDVIIENLEVCQKEYALAAIRAEINRVILEALPTLSDYIALAAKIKNQREREVTE